MGLCGSSEVAPLDEVWEKPKNVQDMKESLEKHPWMWTDASLFDHNMEAFWMHYAVEEHSDKHKKHNHHHNEHKHATMGVGNDLVIYELQILTLAKDSLKFFEHMVRKRLASMHPSWTSHRLAADVEEYLNRWLPGKNEFERLECAKDHFKKSLQLKNSGGVINKNTFYRFWSASHKALFAFLTRKHSSDEEQLAREKLVSRLEKRMKRRADGLSSVSVSRRQSRSRRRRGSKKSSRPSSRSRSRSTSKKGGDDLDVLQKALAGDSNKMEVGVSSLRRKKKRNGKGTETPSSPDMGGLLKALDNMSVSLK